MPKFTIKYPTKTNAGGGIETVNATKKKNDSRLKMLLDFSPYQRVFKPDYGSILSDIEQSMSNSPTAIQAIAKLRSAVGTYMSRYLRITKVRISKVVNRAAEINIDYRSTNESRQ